MMVISSVFAFATTDQALAQSNLCRSLQKQLNSASSGSSKSPQFRRYDKAVRDQQRQIKRTQRAARSGGCYAFSKNSGRCKRLTGAIGKMTANLSKLESKRTQLAGGGSSNKKKRIQATMRKRGCFDKPKHKNVLKNNPKESKTPSRDIVPTKSTRIKPNVTETKPLKKRTRLADKALAVRVIGNVNRSSRRQLGQQVKQRNKPTVGYSTFRTMCVRVSDGYYFPVSFSTIRDRFPADKRTCSLLCPGTETRLYYHRMPSESAEEMIAYKTQRAYANEPFAFNYRRNYNPKNNCRYDAANGSGFIEVAGDNGKLEYPKTAKPEKPRKSRVGKPVYRVDRAADPENIQNDAGNLTLESIAVLVQRNNTEKPIAALSTTTDGREIRAVGPKFFPVQ